MDAESDISCMVQDPDYRDSDQQSPDYRTHKDDAVTNTRKRYLDYRARKWKQVCKNYLSDRKLSNNPVNNNSDKEKGAPVDDTDDLRPRDKTNEMKQINVEDHEAELNNGCKSLHTVTDHPPLVRIESVKIEAVDLESNTNLLENTMRNPRRDIPKSRDKENNRSKVVNKNDVKLLSCKSDSTSSDNITFSAKTGTEVMTDCIGFINPPLKDLESNGNVVENINAKKDQALYNDILKSNVNSFKRKNSNTDPLDSKNGSHDENLKARGAETNDSKTDIKCVDISQYSVNGKAESSNSSVDTGVRHTDSSSLTKYTGAIQTEYLPSSSSKSASDSDHEEINKPFAGIANDPISTSISTNQNLRKLLDKRLDDAKRDSDSRQIKRKGEPSKHSLEKRNCSSLDRLTRMCEQDDPTDNKNYITDELMIPDISPEHLPVESKEINKNKTMPMKVSEAQQTPRSLMDNERPLHEYPHWLDQTRAIPHIHGKMHSGFSFRRDHFRFNEGHSHFRYMIPDHVLPPPFYISNGYNHNLPQQVQFQHGSSTDRPVTDQDYPRKVMYHEEMSHSSKMSLIESDKACGEAEHAAKIKLVAAELEVVGLQKVYWKKRLKQIQDKDSDHNEEL
ncbi:hypothetical protein LOTGIDRAFT_154693 [Lottia gigantea]|uniref:Uncharacterized protein n=1 Tax=Lottia gigantea TaxID=225164 RepID=V4BEB4_LOTGI|nr:hypothetical protein LOTGIDRAFT_154693 [Lottia gigantea]ESO87189.1 hypothetical protein LOTGIDRAFT_154693 [Lottia gigantea]